MNTVLLVLIVVLLWAVVQQLRGLTRSIITLYNAYASKHGLPRAEAKSR